MRVVVIDPGKDPEVMEIDGSLESFQALVGGYIEQVPVRDALGNGFTSFVNEDGIRLELPTNLSFSAMVQRGIVGPAVVTHEDEDDTSELRGLTRDECNRVLATLKQCC